MFDNKVQTAKQEGDSNEAVALPKYTTSTSRQWAGFKNPRIVRVSKAFGGKDRHSKVCTVKGLRDRRIRLSVPTAIQLYDLQDRLGLNQPSKVIDWLIDSTKDDIDKLPPLQMIPGEYFNTQFHHPVLPATTTCLSISQDLNSPQVSFSHHQFLGSGSTTPPNITTFVKDVGNRTLLYTKRDNDHDDGDHERKKGKEALLVENEEENGDGNGAGLNFFPIPHHQYSSYPAGLMFPYINPYCNWEPAPSNLSQYAGNQGVSSHQTHDSSSMAAISASQFLLYPPPPAAAAASSFPPFQLNIPNLGENHDHPIIRQNNQFHLLSSSSQHHVPPAANSLMPLFNLQTQDPPQDKPPTLQF